MVRCGGRMNRRAGLLIATDAGFMSLIGDGHGFLMIRGAGLPITMGAGCMSMAAGDGGRVRLSGIRSIVRYGHRRMYRSSALDLGLELDSDLASASAGSDGCHLDRETSSIPGGDGGAEVTGLLGSANLIVAGSLRCARARGSRT